MWEVAHLSAPLSVTGLSGALVLCMKWYWSCHPEFFLLKNPFAHIWDRGSSYVVCDVGVLKALMGLSHSRLWFSLRSENDLR